ncbi:hypothetical protein C7H19_18580 [Aphanothece hegewaldii CCALA 016]|uniref:Glutathione S-transferase n=1 Tax=Aphanothece hegewaldii CCALA 016 TaxID=2107694 RepID=A0A2T1LU05_9CHRO|nr:hypothetical protein [Aphanothece hegewaldii]PSF34596.1 hypothetical protein C7H19_18580 [Aphanothece hegewaldii CCALA 016]
MNWNKTQIKQICLSFILILSEVPTALALPPAEDLPEEVLRTEIILEGRSPINGQPLSPAEYALLEEQLATSIYPPQINSQIRHLIFLVRIRKVIKTVVPFFPIP